jgi:hypothetical protein
MPVEFISLSSDDVSDTTISLPRPADVEDADLLLMFLVAGTTSGDPQTWTIPDGWTEGLSHYHGTNITIFYAWKYVDTEVDVPSSIYDFVYSTSRPLNGHILAFRGVKRDLSNVMTYPDGYFAPLETIGSPRTGSSQSLLSPAALASVRYGTRAVAIFAQWNSGAEPVMDDVSPLYAIRDRVGQESLSTMVVDHTFEAPTSPLDVLSVHTDINDEWMVFVLPLEAITALADSLDSFKAKIMRSTFPPPYDASWGGPLGALLTVVGGSDNDIGGLFGKSDFLPNGDTGLKNGNSGGNGTPGSGMP